MKIDKELQPTTKSSYPFDHKATRYFSTFVFPTVIIVTDTELPGIVDTEELKSHQSEYSEQQESATPQVRIHFSQYALLII